MSPSDLGAAVRLDCWLCAARIYPSRTTASRAVEGGLVKVNGLAVRPSHLVRCGDEVQAHAPRGPCVLIVRALETKRQGAPRARELYEDHSPPPPPREERVGVRLRGSGRPTKDERRALERLRRFYETD